MNETLEYIQTFARFPFAFAISLFKRNSLTERLDV